LNGRLCPVRSFSQAGLFWSVKRSASIRESSANLKHCAIRSVNQARYVETPELVGRVRSRSLIFVPISASLNFEIVVFDIKRLVGMVQGVRK
jgi:hypothetical protein